MDEDLAKVHPVGKAVFHGLDHLRAELISAVVLVDDLAKDPKKEDLFDLDLQLLVAHTP